ncbi:uncharacterized protein LOC34618435, partial [Cyclospora cayetanensis]|uniref:Uncharacterized protein LOC34618435 n=1 Tax=Cyclospora cayetanensis TaxID=88456 RepID=A0A6P6RR13_9EIME
MGRQRRCLLGGGLGALALSSWLIFASVGDTSDDISLINRGEAYWLCHSGSAGVACGTRREPSLNSSGVYCRIGLCCSDLNDVEPFTCKEGSCSRPAADESDTCTCRRFGGRCALASGASRCVDLPQSGRLSGAACVCESPLIADQYRQKCVPNVCSAGACGPTDAVKFCYPSKVMTSPPGQTKYEATCICAYGYKLNGETQQCLPAPNDRCKKEEPCGPPEGVNTCREHPITGKFICTCRSGFVLNTRDNQCQKKCTDVEAALCGEADSHDAERCSMGIGGRICACKEGFKLDAGLRKCVADSCYTSACGWQEGVALCVMYEGKRAFTCADTFQKSASGECLPECPQGWHYNRKRELCELSANSCVLTDCGPEETVDSCLVDKDSGRQICKCKTGYALDTVTGQCTSHPACTADACQVFGPDAVCVSDGSSAFSCQCISNFKTVGQESTPVVKPCEAVECPDSSICGDAEGVLECVQTAYGHKCTCSPLYMLETRSGRCVPSNRLQLKKNEVPKGSLRVSATRAPLHFIINAAPCVSAEFNLTERTLSATAYHTSGHTHTTLLTLPYHPGSYTGAAFTFRMSPVPGGFDISFVYELRPTQHMQVLEQAALRVYLDPETRQAFREAGGGLDGAVAAVNAAAKQKPCEVAFMEVVPVVKNRQRAGQFQNLSSQLNKLPTADANAPSTNTKFPEVDPSIPKPEEPDPETIDAPESDTERLEPPEPEIELPLPDASPPDPTLPPGDTEDESTDTPTTPPPDTDETPETPNSPEDEKDVSGSPEEDKDTSASEGDDEGTIPPSGLETPGVPEDDGSDTGDAPSTRPTQSAKPATPTAPKDEEDVSDSPEEDEDTSASEGDDEGTIPPSGSETPGVPEDDRSDTEDAPSTRPTQSAKPATPTAPKDEEDVSKSPEEDEDTSASEGDDEGTIPPSGSETPGVPEDDRSDTEDAP